MLFVLIGALVSVSIILLLVRRGKMTVYLLGASASLLLQITGMMIFIAKKGGFQTPIIRFLFFSTQVRSFLRDSYITLGTIGFLVALGRYLYPMFILELAMEYSAIERIRQRPWLRWAVCVVPAALLVCYTPSLYRACIYSNAALRDFLYYFSIIYIVVYLGTGMVLQLHEYRSIRMRFYRRRYTYILLFLLAMTVLYVMYCPQDPGQIYRFYSYDYGWYSGLGYLMFAPGLSGYIAVVLLNVVGAVLGVTSILRYTQDHLAASQEEIVMEAKFDVARTGVAVFVHSIKNQLLANRVLEKRMYAELSQPQPDVKKLREELDALHENNEMLLGRTQDLYRTSKNNYMTLVPTNLAGICNEAVQRLHRKYPEAQVAMAVDDNIKVMADLNYLSEAFYNILVNAWEATICAAPSALVTRPDKTSSDKAASDKTTGAGRLFAPIRLRSHDLRRDIAVEISDHGCGIAKEDLNKIFEPFYSSKNSTRNWGMGLNYVRTIVHAHRGSIKAESQPGEGTTFYIMLPKYF